MKTKSQRVKNFSSSEIHRLATIEGDIKWKFYKNDKQIRATRSFDDEIEANKFAKINPELVMKVIDERRPSSAYSSYIEEKMIEIRLNLQLNGEHAARPTTWGTYAEKFAFENIGIEYKLESKKRYVHSKINRWTGAPDVISEEKSIVGDIKCPYTRKSFAQMVNALEKGETEKEIGQILKEVKKEYYWQAVSNSILTKSKKADLILYMPFKEELQQIRDSLNNYKKDDIYKFYWIQNSNDEELPHIIKGEYYNNIYCFRFVIPEEDKKFLRDRIRMANEDLDLMIDGQEPSWIKK